MTHINEETVEYLAKLARIEVSEDEKRKLSGDMEEILNFFEGLKEVDTSAVEPMTGGTQQRNVVREDGEDIRSGINGTHEDIINAFPEEERGYLKVPAVFGE